VDRREFVAAAVALPFALRAGTARAGGTPLALVTADAEAALVAYGLSERRVLRRVPVLPGPRSIESVGDAAVVAHTAVGAVTILDAPTLGVRHVLRSFDEPRYTAAAPGGRHAFVTDSGRAAVAAVDVVRGRVVARVRLRGWPRHLALDPSGRFLWVALGTESPELAVVDVARDGDPRIVGRVRPPFLAHDVGFAPDGRHAWVTSGDRGTVGIFDLRGRLRRLLRADAPPQHVTFLGGAAFVTSGDDGTLRMHSLRGGRVLRTARIPTGSYNVQQGWGVVLTPSLARGTLAVANARGRVITERTLARSSHDACFVMAA
jgi:DNA-binding beta-propeller fold protein YncE